MNKILAASVAIVLCSNAYLTHLVLQIQSDLRQGLVQIPPVKAATGSSAPSSPEIEAALTETGEIVRNRNKWPASSAEATKHINRLSQAIVSADIPNPLVVRNWELEALRLLTVPPTSASASDTEDLLADRPPGSDEAIAKALEEAVARARSKAAKDIDKLIASAEQQPPSAKAIAELIDKLSSYSEPRATEAAAKLRQRLPTALLQDSLLTLENELATAIPAIKDPGLRDYGLVRLKQAVLDARLRITLEAAQDLALQNRAAALDSKVTFALQESENTRAKQQAKQLRDYQVWALESLKKVREYDAILEEEKSKLGNPRNPIGADTKMAEARAQGTLRGEMVVYMAPISLGALDEPVAQWYRKVYQKRFDKLNDDEKASLTLEFANTEKRTPRGIR